MGHLHLIFCRTVLAQELHTHPSPETMAIAERLRTEPHFPRQMATAVLTTSFLRENPLIGRASELHTLITAYQRAQRGHPQVVILAGEAGIGKTRLAREFLDRMAAQGADVLWGQALATEDNLPYQPLVEALRRRIAQEHAPEHLLENFWLAELSSLLPELQQRHPDLLLPLLDKATARIRLFEAVTRLFQALARRAPVVLFIDDLQGADIASLNLLSYALRRWQENEGPILVLLNVRAEALGTRPKLADWLDALERAVPVTRLTLDPLSYQDTLRLVQALGTADAEGRLDPAITADLGQLGHWLFHETQGHPLYVLETLKALLDLGILRSDPQRPEEWVADFAIAARDTAVLQHFLPPGVQAAIRSRLAPLSTHARTLLTAAAVLGHSFTFDQLCQVAGLEVDSALTALDELLRNLLLREHAGTYAFTHDKIRAVIYAQAGEARRHILHRRAQQANRN